MPEVYRHPTFDGRCRIYALGKGGLSNGAIARRPGRGPSTVSRGLRRSGGGRYTGPGGRRGSSPGSAGRRSRRSRGGLEPGTDPGSPPAGGSGNGGQAADIRPRPGQREGRRKSVDAPAATWKEAEPAGWPPRGPGPYPGPEGHPGAPGDRRGEGRDRRPGGGHRYRRGPWRRGGVACGPGVGTAVSPAG